MLNLLEHLQDPRVIANYIPGAVEDEKPQRRRLQKELDRGLTRHHEVLVHGVVHGARLEPERHVAHVNGLAGLRVIDVVAVVVLLRLNPAAEVKVVDVSAA